MSRHSRSRGSQVLAAARILLLALVVVAAAYAVVRNWREVSATVTHLSWRAWLPAFFILPVAIGCSTMSWQVLVDELGEPIGARRGAQIFLVGQLGKYVPGSVWAYVLQLELGRRAGVARARIFAATVFSLAVIVVAALLAGALAVPSLVAANPDLARLTWLYLLLPVAVVCLHPRILTFAVRQGFRVLGRPAPEHPVRKRAILTSLGWALASSLAFGAHLWLLVRSSTPISVSVLPLAVGTMSVAMISGLFVFLLPSGAGVREVVLVAGLGPVIGAGPAIAIAAVSRVLLTVADLATAGAAAVLATIEQRRHGPYHGDPGIEHDEA
ncbi:MAG: flippase-like domain-containing protein [Actinomycetales bacterium]|nr:flippase-like domain-containing protein [Actinomycetales bacterium]